MNFAPKSDSELSRLIPKAEYDFEVLTSEDAVSKKSGSDMIKIQVGIYKDGELVTCIFDYLIESVAYKLKHFCQATGLSKRYDDGNLQAHDCSGRVGKCKVGISVDKTGNYPNKNEISDYIPDEKVEEQNSAVQDKQQSPEEDGLPF